MKKITLVLCACAIAFAGLLVSCNNATGDYVNTTSAWNRYEYKVTGTFKQVDKDGAVASPTVASDE